VGRSTAEWDGVADPTQRTEAAAAQTVSGTRQLLTASAVQVSAFMPIPWDQHAREMSAVGTLVEAASFPRQAERLSSKGVGSAEWIEFPDMAALNAWYTSPEYQPLIPLRHASAKDMLIKVEGA